MTTTTHEVHIFDFQSHESMHLNFNEGYLRTIATAFPCDRISFYACDGHIATLAARTSDLRQIKFSSIQRFAIPLGLSRHNPIAGRWAAGKCKKVLQTAISNRPVRFVALLGEDAHLYAVIGRNWKTLCEAPLHMILHNHLGEAVRWRSRNPFIRIGDLISQVKYSLPDNVLILALELGVRERIHELFPVIGPSVRTYEHPLLRSEWLGNSPHVKGSPWKIAFLGNSSRTKGFHVFVSAANQCAGPNYEFHAIGIASGDSRTLDLNSLTRQPAEGGLPREEYLKALGEMDFVCLPLSNIEYDFIASGSIIDAIAGLKPILALRTRVLESIFAKYGPIGHLADSEEDLLRYITNEIQGLHSERSLWVENLKKIREARQPEVLGQHYAALVGMNNLSHPNSCG